MIGELEASGLRGRGGAGFPAGRKASFLPEGRHGQVPRLQRRRVRARHLQGPRADAEVPAPADRGHRDRRAAPPASTARSSTSAASTSCRRRSSTRRSREAYAAGYIGERHPRLATCRCQLVLHRGAGAYICGEETGLLDSLEGKRGNPRLKPPFPAIEGLYGGPTLINNVETLATCRRSSRMGGERVREARRRAARPAPRSSPSPATCSARATTRSSSACPSREIIYGLAGGPPDGRTVKLLVPRRLELAGADRRGPRPPLRLRQRWPRPASMLGSGAIIVVDDSTPILDVALKVAQVLPPRVLRQVHALPRGHQLDGEDARADRVAARRPRWTSTSWPRSRSTSSATACACSATRWRCRSGR